MPPTPPTSSALPPGQQPKLLDRLREALRSRHYNRRTEHGYCHWVKRFPFFHKVRHPSEMVEPEINALLTHLAVKQKVMPSTQNQALNALLYPYRHVLDREIGNLGDIIRARTPKRLPVVMTREEARAVLSHPDGRRHAPQVRPDARNDLMQTAAFCHRGFAQIVYSYLGASFEITVFLGLRP